MKKNILKKMLKAAGVLSVVLLSGVGLASCDDGGETDVSDVDLSTTKSDAILSLNSYKDKSNYKDAQKAEIDNIINDAKTKINEATSKESIDLIVNEAKNKLDAVKTSTQIDAEESESAISTAKTSKIAAIDTLASNYKESDYRANEWKELTKLISDVKAEVNAMTTKSSIDDYSIDTLKDKLDAIKTDAKLTEEETKALEDAKAEKIKAIDALASLYPKENYRESEQTEITKAISEAKAEVNALTTLSEVNAYTTTALYNKLKAIKSNDTYIAEELDAAKTLKKTEIEEVLNDYSENDYSTTNWNIIKGYITSAKAEVDKLTTKALVEAYKLDTLKANIDAVKTSVEEAKAAMILSIDEILNGLKETNYSSINWAKITNYITKAKEEVNGLTTAVLVNAYDIEALKTNVASVKANVSYDTLSDAFTSVDFSYNTNISEDVVIDGENAVIINDWCDAWFSSNITIKNIIFKQGATFSAQTANISSKVTITFENCTFYACQQSKIDVEKWASKAGGVNLNNSGDGLCLDIETSDSTNVNVVVKNSTFNGEDDVTLDRKGYQLYNATNKAWENKTKSRGHAIAINAIAGGGTAGSVLIDGNTMTGIRGNAIQLYNFNYAITVQNNIINSWGRNNLTSNMTKDDAAIRGTIESDGTLTLTNNYFGLDENVESKLINGKTENVGLYHVNVDNYTGNSTGSRVKGTYSDSGEYQV